MPTPLLGPLVRRPLLVVALLAATLLAVLPAVTSAQPLPPRQFWGSNDSVTIGGEPWDGSTIVVINEAGEVIATVERESTAWSVYIPNDVDSFRFRASNGGVSEVYSPGPGAIRENFVLMIGSPPGEVPTRAVALEEDFNFIVWTGHTTAIDDALAGFPDRSELTAIWEFDTGQQTWLSYRPGRPAFINTIADLQAGTAYYLLVGAAMTWDMPTNGELAGTRTIADGFTAIGWVGPDATPQDVLDAIADPAAVTAFFRFNASTQKYDSYRSNLPASFQGIRSIQPFDVLFISATSADHDHAVARDRAPRP